MDDGAPPRQSASAHTTQIVYQPLKIDNGDEFQRQIRSQTGSLHVAFTNDPAEDDNPLQNRWILDPGSNTHAINSEDWIGWSRKYENTPNTAVGAGTQNIPITAWGNMNLMAQTPQGLQELLLSHVAYVPGFKTNLIGLARCRPMSIHFDSGRDLLYETIREAYALDRGNAEKLWDLSERLVGEKFDV